MIATSDITMPDWLKEEHKTGTTIVAAEFNGGVIIAADSRTTTGAYVANRVTDKLTPLSDRIFCLRSGSAADTQAVADFVKYNLEFHEMETGSEPLVNTAAYLAKSLIYNNKERLLASVMVAGWDSKKGGQVYVVPISGMIVRKSIYISGSGSIYAMGYLDAFYRPNMERNECLELIKNAVAMAIARDGSSGGCIRYAIVTDKGVERNVLLNTELPRFYEN
ncbi:unnamed protein product [Brachionus calyciflorus]|uniref:proteasome endopeptidase complex n=1 Tax=Brachionus calyciflorus TaxID=104777 RepID=A0A814B9J3_9BILA|nr:unnamed protein product [Brachionus calyciflorus]